MMLPEDDYDLPQGQGIALRSNIVPSNGQIYTMYHGTSKNSEAQILRSGFKPSSGGMLGPGVHLSRDLQKASKYPIELLEKDRMVFKVKVNVGRVKKIDYQNHPMQKTWHAEGYDTAWVPPYCGMVKSNLEEDCVWDPSRITIITVIRPKVIAAEGEMNASRALKEALLVISESPSGLQLRYLQILSTIAAEKNSTIIFPLPMDIISHFMKK